MRLALGSVAVFLTHHVLAQPEPRPQEAPAPEAPSTQVPEWDDTVIGDPNQNVTAVPRSTASGPTEFVPGEILVGFHPNISAAQKHALRLSLGATQHKDFPQIAAQHWRLPPGLDMARAAQALAANPGVRYAEPNYIWHANDFLPNDPLRTELWGMHNVGQTGGQRDADIGALEAWQLQPGSEPVVVAVIDTGIDYTHQDLAGRVWVNPGEIPDNDIDDDGNGFVDDFAGWDFVNGDHDPLDDSNHGTHVAGTIAGNGNDDFGVIGVAGLNPNVKLMPLKFLSAAGTGTTDNAIAAFLYAASFVYPDGSKVVRISNNSWSGSAASTALQEAIRASGQLVVCAAGNSGSNNVSYPAGYDEPNIIAVAATDANDRLASFSNYGDWVDLCAPGVDILSSTRNNTYSRFTGTSMASPHVAGTAALLLSQDPALDTVRLKDQLLATVDPVPALTGKTVTGGRLNAARALGAPPLDQDTTAPVPVADLGIDSAQTTQTSVVLQWTVPSDAGGPAYCYDVRYHLNSPVVEENWRACTRVFGAPIPLSAGSPQTVQVPSLYPGLTYYFAVRLLDAAGNASPLSANASITLPPLEWRTIIVDRQGYVGGHRSLAINSSGYPIVAYSDDVNDRVKLSTWTGSSWTVETFGTGRGGISLALTPAGAPTVSWADSNRKLYFAAKSRSKWDITTLESTNVQTDVTSLAYGADGNPAISYRTLYGEVALKLAWKSGSSWKTQVVHPGAGARYSSLAFAPDGHPAIAYSEDLDKDNWLDALMLAEGVPSAGSYTWTCSEVETGVAGYGVFCSLQFDSNGNPIILHGYGSSNMRIVRRSGTAWFGQEVGSATGGCDLSVGANGHACIAYVRGATVKVASAILPDDPRESAVWTSQLAEVDGTVGWIPSIRVSPSGIANLAYAVSGALRLTSEMPGYAGPDLLLFDDMETAAYAWKAEGNTSDPTQWNKPPKPGAANLWHKTTRRGSDGGHTPVTSWYYGIDAQDNYDTGARNWGRLISPSMTLPAGARALLTVSQFVQGQGNWYESGQIQVSTAGGPWTTIFQRSTTSATSFIADQVDLSAYLGQSIRLGFFFDTRDRLSNQYEGWYLDDVVLKWWP